MRCTLVGLTFGAAVVFLATSATADDSNLDWYTIDSGGAMSSTGGDFDLSGTIGQPDAGTMSGGDFALAGGFWPAAFRDCPADLNGDAMVDLFDLQILLSNYGTPSGAHPVDGDLDGDGDVDLADLQALLTAYGTTC